MATVVESRLVVSVSVSGAKLMMCPCSKERLTWFVLLLNHLRSAEPRSAVLVKYDRLGLRRASRAASAAKKPN